MELARRHDLPNILFVGFERVAQLPSSRLSVLGGALHVCALPGPLTFPSSECSAIVLQRVDALLRDQQRELLLWMERGPRVPVWSLSPAPLYPLVQEGRFEEPLYYRLNVLIEHAGEDIGRVNYPFARSRRRLAKQAPPASEQVARRAYELFRARGGADGRDIEDWVRAERQLESERRLPDEAAAS